MCEDDDGYYVYCGRRDDMLKVSGMYVSPFEVEGMLQSHPDVLEAAVVGWPDDDELIKPKAFVVLKAPETAGDSVAQALQDECRRSLRCTNIRAGSSSAPNCRKPPPGRFSASSCAPRPTAARLHAAVTGNSRDGRERKA